MAKWSDILVKGNRIVVWFDGYYSQAIYVGVVDGEPNMYRIKPYVDDRVEIIHEDFIIKKLWK